MIATILRGAQPSCLQRRPLDGRPFSCTLDDMSPTPSSQISLVNEDESPQFQRIASEDVLAPGYYWRLKNDFKVHDTRWSDHSFTLHARDVHLLVDIFEFEGAPHTAILLSHPRNGCNSTYRILIADFLTNFEPAKDAEAVRTDEQTQIMREVAAMQEEMAQAQENPLALPGVKAAVEEALEKFEREMVAEVAASQETQTKRTSDLRKIHRRAARRSTAAGNPLVARSVTISDQVGLMISGGINSEGLQELTVEARKRIAIAESTSKWLIARNDDIATKLKCLAPYYAEKGKVALARASKAIKYVKDITQGLNSLKLYTGDGVDVVSILEGASASTIEPLTLVQGKRYMDEELAVWVPVEDSFDWHSQRLFFEALKANPSLVDQVFPAPRCVVSMAVTSRSIEYSRETTAFQRVMNEINNRAVFLLVRDGQNIHVVYSSEPSHEAADRLFPTQSEIEGEFKGIDGTRIGLQDVAFGKSVENFNDLSLHYKRFLILLCGLDHRLKLFGEFYPPENGLQFMSIDFQQKFFLFLDDDNPARLLGENLEPVQDWISRCNKAVRSGSRVITSLDRNMRSASPQLQRMTSMEVDSDRLPAQMVVSREKGCHYISMPTSNGRSGDRGQANVWLDGPDNKDFKDWFLCMDLVRLETVQRYIYSRINRSGHISWLRAFKRAEAILLAEKADQAELRAALAKAALENGVLREGEVDEAIENAIATWRAAHRGADAPALTDTKALHELLSLMYPSDRIAKSTESMVDRLISDLGCEPLMLCRTGKNRLTLYVEATPDDKAPYASGVQWGWVKRVLIDVLKTKLSVASTSLVWLQKDKPNAMETLLREWPLLSSWIQEHHEPCPVRWLSDAKTAITSQAALLGDVLAKGRGAPVQSGLDETFTRELLWDAIDVYAKLSYYESVWTAVPVGVLQASAGKPVHFLYARVKTAHFVHRYGNPDQWSDYKSQVLLDDKHSAQRALQDAIEWTLIQTSEPIKKTAFRASQVNSTTPAGTKIESHESGGVKRKDRRDFFNRDSTTRAKRRAAGGAPLHHRATLDLSWSRSIESILGIAPHLRRKFYSDAKRFRWSDKNEQIKFEPQVPLHHLSPLIWNAEQGRSVANRYFSTTKTGN
ncbi:hypothetical protein Rfer_4471 (plasmid) [Rhodoferax ferrireducens T118]|uniref:Uncharacterized protein n=1 Tax=Albidiferax ferrireducens (strain ATCC BAA-621 / DSM 15236 / T118) TaxID=338969 RepID=Q21PY8_ALBFT|nr:hypothetical protein [Rhodoferax ferrireducens]ABD72157.1 hypothetical protein Rfer_4471 [Rhodoferax ferrireducens T118]